MLLEYNVKKLIILPLYPQYSCSTTASVFDEVANILKKYRSIPSVIFIRDYADNTKYIHALKRSIKNSFNMNGYPERLILSFHGIPKKYIEDGDDYLERCKTTKKLLISVLDYPKNQIIMMHLKFIKLNFLSYIENKLQENIMNRSIEIFSRSRSALSTHKVLRNTYLLLSITVAFSALIATITNILNLPYLGVIPTLIGFYSLLFLVNYLSNKKSGILATFALTGFMGYTIAPIINIIFSASSGKNVAFSLFGTALVFFVCSMYSVKNKRDLSLLSSVLISGSVALLICIISNMILHISALSIAISIICNHMGNK
uniref:Ferrochelatase n=1 Tax=Glossina palpalis gambiensis TaxID=67801 RepID=A0A1B0C6T7_9MUSC